MEELTMKDEGKEANERRTEVKREKHRGVQQRKWRGRPRVT